MKDVRLIWNSVLLSLPAAMLVAAVVYFLIDKVPVIAADEHQRVVQEYRVLAAEAKEEDRGEPFDFEASGFKRTNLRIMRESWGYEGDTVWYYKGGEARRLRVKPIAETDYATPIRFFGILIMLLFTGITAFGVRYFWKFVKSRDDFMAATAHDLTTPLVAMRRMIGRDDGEARNLNERMIRLVENIKAFMRLGGRRPRPVISSFDLVAVCRSAYALFREDFRDLFDGRDVPFETEEPEMRVSADETLVSQIVWNLLGNDLKYAAPFGAVKARIFRDGDRVVFELADEGRGMTPREMRKAFDRYYRAKTVLESGKGGFGIGLCNAREFARAMGGELTVRANVPHGCVFTLTLPRQILI